MTSFRRVRSKFVPPSSQEVARTEEATTEEGLGGAAPPTLAKRRRKRAEAPVMRASLLGIQRKDVASVPTEVWNRFQSILRDSLRSACKVIGAAYDQGIEASLGDLVGSVLPSVAHSVGVALIESVLEGERGSYGTWLECPPCATRTLKLQGYKPRAIRTVVGTVTIRRARYL